MGKVISLKDRLETVKNKNATDNIKSICLSLAEDSESYKRIIVIYETLEGDIGSSWVGIDTGNIIVTLLDGFLHKLGRIVNSATKQTCPKCGSRMCYAKPTIYDSRWHCISSKCNK